jgi:hypothetical protein
MKRENRTILKLCLLIFLSAVFQLKNVTGQIVVDEAPRALYYERTMRVKKFKDMKDMRDVFHYDKFLLGRKRIYGNISYNWGRVLIDDGSIHNEYRSALSFFTRIRFFEEFSLNTNFYKDFNPRASARWISDYTYAIGRYNWKPRRFNYGYENYLNNKYSDDWKTFKEKFMEGWYFISYSHNLETKKIMLDSTTNIRLTYFARYSVKYMDSYEVPHGGLWMGKPILGIGFRYTFIRNIYFESAVYYYFDPAIHRQQPWDPDYSYGFGYFDWRAFRISLTYGNWVVNRFPWNKSFYPHYGFIDGNFKIVANWIW